MTQDFEVCQAGELARIRAQRDALAEALELCADYVAIIYEEGREHHAVIKADAALATLEAGKGPL